MNDPHPIRILAKDTELLDIPVLRCDRDFPLATLKAFETETHKLIDGATRGVPDSALKVADTISRRWLTRSGNEHLPEIDAIAKQLARPGAYFLSVNYEWGCTVAVRPVGDHAELIRVLDWRTPGLGRYVVLADIAAHPGRFQTLTWPGYTGVLQANAPGRFAAAINQAPMPHRGGGLLPLDWLANKIEVWRSTNTTPAHLLRNVFEQAATFAEARQQLTDTPISTPAIFSLVGCRPDELCIIERTETAAHVHDGARAAANTWQAPNWSGRPRGLDSTGRVRQLTTHSHGETRDLDWLQPPVLNDTTRLAAIMVPGSGTLLAQGFEGLAPATRSISKTFEQDQTNQL
jgi:hypothetical protein